MMYQKALLFNDPDTGAEILRTTAPRTVKSLGRKVQNFDEKTWLEHRYDIVRRGTLLKFTRVVSEAGTPPNKSDREPLGGESLRARLLSTGDAELLEASPYDRVWGIGFVAAQAEANRANWGLNLLGKALMEVREQLRKEDERKAQESAGESK